MDLAKAKSFLMRAEGGTSLYEHLVELVLKLVVEQPDNALATLEALSASTKGKSFPDFAAGGHSAGAASTEELVAGRAALLAAQLAVFKAPVADEEGAGGPGEPVQNLTEDAALLEWGGVGLGRTEAFRLHLALKHLASKFPVKNLRWWGRVFGRSADYLVAEGVMDSGEGEEGDEDKDALGNVLQKTGDGPNRLTYFVCGGVGQPWTRLPRVTPHQISAARLLRRFFTGDLNAPVAGHPPFPGNESNLLRATISLISSATLLAPAGSLVAVEGDEGGATEPNGEEWEAPDFSSGDGWVHSALELNALGRTRPNPPVLDGEGNEVAVEGAPEPSVPLRPVSEDPPVDEAAAEGGGAWAFSSCPSAGLAEGEAASGPFVAKSLRWPGAVAVGQGKKSACAYVGWGLPVVTAPYQPSLPAQVPAQCNYFDDATRCVEAKDVTVDPTPPPEEGEGEAEEEA